MSEVINTYKLQGRFNNNYFFPLTKVWVDRYNVFIHERLLFPTVKKWELSLYLRSKVFLVLYS